MREGSIDAPTRHPLDWKSDNFWDKDALNDELERVFDVCHGCRRCVSLCDAFPTLFDLIDESETLEVDGVDKADYQKVAEQCYLCDLCYLTKCPYVPPHEFNVDFPHLMLRAKAQRFKDQGASLRDRTLTSTDRLLGATSIPLIDVTVNALNNTGVFRKALSAGLDIHHEAPLPKLHSKTLRKRVKPLLEKIEPAPVGTTTGKVALYATCYANHFSQPDSPLRRVGDFDHESRLPVVAIGNQGIVGTELLFNSLCFKDALDSQHLLNLIANRRGVLKIESRVLSQSKLTILFVSHYLGTEVGASGRILLKAPQVITCQVCHI